MRRHESVNTRGPRIPGSHVQPSLEVPFLSTAREDNVFPTCVSVILFTGGGRGVEGPPSRCVGGLHGGGVIGNCMAFHLSFLVVLKTFLKGMGVDSFPILRTLQEVQ